MLKRMYFKLSGCCLIAILSIVGTPLSAQMQPVRAAAAMQDAFSIAPLPSRGSAQAQITVLIFSDFESFPCGRSASVLAGLLGETDIRVIFKHAPSPTNPNAFLAHEAALAAGAQGKFWEMHDLLFENQTKLTRADLIGYAKQLGLDLPTFEQALDKHTYRPIIERDLAEAQALGVTTVPTFFVNGRRMVGPQGRPAFEAVFATVLAGKPAPSTKRLEAVASGPAQAIELEHAPAKGPATAPVSIVEFVDFECPFCAKAAPVVRQLLAAYPTQVRYAVKSFPLPFHRESALAHEATLAAGDQGKFWEMHDLIFASQDKLSRADLIAKATQLKLDVARFTKDLDSHRFKSQVDSDRQEGDRLGVDGTPYFFINGHGMAGATDFAEFKQLIETALKESSAPAAKPSAAPVK